MSAKHSDKARDEQAVSAAANNAAETPGNPADPATPTVTHYQLVANDVAKAIDAVRALIPDLTIPHGTTRRFVHTHKNVSADFIASAVAAVESIPKLASAVQFDAVKARDTLQLLEAFRPIVDRLDALAGDLQFTLDSRKAETANEALLIYATAKSLARDPANAEITSHAGNLRRDLGRTRGRARKSAQEPPPAQKAS